MDGWAEGLGVRGGGVRVWVARSIRLVRVPDNAKGRHQGKTLFAKIKECESFDIDGVGALQHRPNLVWWECQWPTPSLIRTVL